MRTGNDMESGCQALTVEDSGKANVIHSSRFQSYTVSPDSVPIILATNYVAAATASSVVGLTAFQIPWEQPTDHRAARDSWVVG